jgi:uncharacterized protein with FMN-binding domain
MKRAPLFVFAGTVAGLAGILSFHTHPQTSAPAASAGTPAAKASPTTAARRQHRTKSKPAGSTAASSDAVRNLTGATERYGYGRLAVRVTVRGSRIINVSVPTLETSEQYSQQLAENTIPTLRQEVLAAQSAHINAVSGATYTSDAYAESVQAALDKLHHA